MDGLQSIGHHKVLLLDFIWIIFLYLVQHQGTVIKSTCLQKRHVSGAAIVLPCLDLSQKTHGDHKKIEIVSISRWNFYRIQFRINRTNVLKRLFT